jgi:peptidase E
MLPQAMYSASTLFVLLRSWVRDLTGDFVILSRMRLDLTRLSSTTAKLHIISVSGGETRFLVFVAHESLG